MIARPVTADALHGEERGGSVRRVSGLLERRLGGEVLMSRFVVCFTGWLILATSLPTSGIAQDPKQVEVYEGKPVKEWIESLRFPAREARVRAAEALVQIGAP